MFLETFAAAVILGFLVGALFSYVAAIRPLERQVQARERADIRASRLRLYRLQAKVQHRGTPYIKPYGAPVPTEVEKLLADIDDNERWSQKAPQLEVLS